MKREDVQKAAREFFGMMSKPKFPCDICGKILNFKGGLANHLRRVHEDEWRTNDKIRTKDLDPLYPKIPCRSCKATARTEAGMAEHVRRIHLAGAW